MNMYEYFLHRTKGIGNAGILSLLNEFGTAENVYKLCIQRSKILETYYNNLKYVKDTITAVFEFAARFELENEYNKLISDGVSFVSYCDNSYPGRLRELTNPPFLLYYKGNLPDDLIPSVAIIGARKCSSYGEYLADMFGQFFAMKNINVISGMALGIDGLAQNGVIKRDGRTYGVLGSGVTVCYPSYNRSIYNKMQERGGIISIFDPYAGPNKQFFPERNRIVSALADIIIVIEARQKSGTGITVSFALKQGKEVYAVPGRITDRLSDGCNFLIRNGAGVALSPEDVLMELEILWNRKHKDSSFFISNNKKNNLCKPISSCDNDINNPIMNALDVNPKSIDEIYNSIITKGNGITIESVSRDIIRLCIEGKVKQIGAGYFYKVLDRT